MEDQRARFVVDRFNAMLAEDGAHLEVEASTDDELRLRYVPGPEGLCETCVLDPEDLRALIGEALSGVAVTVRTE